MGHAAAKSLFDPIRSARTFEFICERIRDDLVSGALKAGDRLPAERELAEQFQVGRNAVREAMRSLEQAGVVELRKGRNGGAYIRGDNTSQFTQALRDLLEFGSVSLSELTQARAEILDLVTRLAGACATATDFDALTSIIDDTERHTLAGDFDKRAASIRGFYAALARLTRNRVLEIVVTSLSESLWRYVHATRSQGYMTSYIVSRRRYIDLLRAGRTDDAAEELRTSFSELQSRIEQILRSRGTLRPRV